MKKLIAFVCLVLSSCGHDALNPICGNVGANQCYAVPGVTPGVPEGTSDYTLKEYHKAAGIGACTTGIPTCDKDYNIIACEGEGPLPSDETCDLQDNDCDGPIDEGWDNEPLIAYGADDTCGTFGKCAEYNAVCINGQFICPYEPRPEQCDNEDNDCDARTDEDLEAGLCFDDEYWKVTNGTCRAGVMRCISGGMRCDGQVLPGPELCDSEDNDCNGIVDDTGDVLSSKYDIVFGIDTSGSMCDEIGAVAAALSEYVDQFQGNNNFRWAIVGMSEDYADLVQVIVDFTDITTIQQTLLTIGCYGSGSEASLDILYDVCLHSDGLLGLSWRSDANALVFSFTDEPAQTYTAPPTTDLLIVDTCIQHGVLPFQWSLSPLQFRPIVEAANGLHFTLVNDWETIFEDMNSIVITLCGS